MNVTVTTERLSVGLEAIVVENDLLRLVILPELGAKIWELTYKPLDRQLLWHHPNLEPRRLPFGSSYDDHFFGGWDELFPNDQPEPLGGVALPDHGELWTATWQHAVSVESADAVTIHLWLDTPLSGCRVEKWLTLRADEAVLRFRHRLTNGSDRVLPFLWKLHPALAINEHCRIDLPTGSMYVEEFGPPRGGRTGVSYEWPFWEDERGKRHDMRAVLPASARVNEFQYATELTEGWCALTDTRQGVGFGLAFDPTVLRSCWLFATYGGWNDLYTLVLEPCTGYPLGVADGIATGTHQQLPAGKSLLCDVTAVVFEHAGAVTGIDLEGNVR